MVGKFVGTRSVHWGQVRDIRDGIEEGDMGTNVDKEVVRSQGERTCVVVSKVERGMEKGVGEYGEMFVHSGCGARPSWGGDL